MKTFTIKSMFLSITFVTLLLFVLGSQQSTSGQTFLVCNTGSADVWVAYLQVSRGIFFGDSWKLSGWTQVSNQSLGCRNPIYNESGEYNVVYAVKIPGGGLGAVKYDYSRSGPGRLKEICVSPDNGTARGSGSMAEPVMGPITRK